MASFTEDFDVLNGRMARCSRSADVAGKSVLDVGCSFGWFEEYALEMGARRIVGVDPNQQNLMVARRHVPHACFVEGSATSLPFLNNSFELITMFDTIEHLPKGTEQSALVEIARVLEPGGELVLSTPYDSLRARLLDPAWYLGHRHYSEAGLHRLMARAGLEVRATSRGGAIWESLGMLVFYIWKWGLRRNMPFKRWFDRKRAEEYARHDGFGTVFVHAVRVS